MNKKDLSKVKPGTWIEVWWNDNPNTTVLLLGKVDPKLKGDISLLCFDPDCDEVNRHITHTQVVCAHEKFNRPEASFKHKCEV